MKITGYGKGWQEPKARTILWRILQRAREPATTADYVILMTIFVLVINSVL